MCCARFINKARELREFQYLSPCLGAADTIHDEVIVHLELSDGCIQDITEDAVQFSGVIPSGRQDRLQHSNVRAGHGLVNHAIRIRIQLRGQLKTDQQQYSPG